MPVEGAVKDGKFRTGDFRLVVDPAYDVKKPKKHKSPTKRLMQQKEAAWKHKEFLKTNHINYIKKTENDKYSLAYVCDPKKTYVI